MVSFKKIYKHSYRDGFVFLYHLYFSHFLLNGYFTFSTKTTMEAFHCKNSLMPCTNLPDKVLMTKSSFCSKSTTLTVSLHSKKSQHVHYISPRLFHKKKWSIACSKVVTLRIPFSPPLLTISSIGKSLKGYFVLKQ